MPSMDGFASKIGKEFGSQGNAAGKAFGDSMTVGIDGGAKKSSGILTGLGTVAKGVATAALAGFTALTGAVTAIGGAALSAYADYEQLVGGVDTLFGSASQTLQGYAAEAYKTCGMSANQYMTQATSFAASLVSSCSGDVAKAADYANMAMGDMSDNVNKMGSDMADVQNAYQGFAKQNYTMLDNLKLGYGGTQAEMKRLIADANKLRQEQGKNADLTIDSYADVVEAIHTVQENMGITGTTAKEAATTISGSIGMAKAAWENFITGLGRDDVDFSQLTQQLLESIGAVATNVAPRVAQIGKGIVEAFPVVLSGLGPVLGPVFSEALATAWNIAVGALAELGIQLPTVDASQITGAFQAIADTAASVVSTVSGAVTTTISAVSPFVTDFASQMLPAIASFASGAVGAFSAVRPVMEQLGSTLLNVGQAILPVLHNAFAMIVPIISQVIGVAMQLFAAVSPLVSQVGAALMPAITSIGTALANLANAVLPILASGMQIVLSVVQMLIPVIQTVLSVVGSIVSVVITVASQVISVVVNAASVVASAIGLVMSVVSGLVAAVTTFIGSIVSVVGSGIATVVAAVSGGVSAVVSFMGSMVSSALAFVSGLVSSIAGYFSTMVSTMANAAQQVYAAVTGAFSALVGAVSGHIGSLMNTISSIPGQVMGFFAGAGSWLVDSGRALINGFTRGIQNAIGGALSAVSGAVSQIRSFFPFSPAKRGPFSGHGYTTYSGKALMEGWAEGIGSGTGAVNSAITSALASASSLIGSGITVAPPVAVAGAGAAGTTYNVTVSGGSLNADQRIMQAVDVLVSAAKRSAGSGR
jgi:phage-related protein